MDKYVNLNRQFCVVDRTELDDVSTLLFESQSHYFSEALCWDQLLERRRVVILGQAGTGKTRELQEQQDRLFRVGKPAFFLTLENLARDGIAKSLNPGHRQRFSVWAEAPSEPAWFFLDALDELKLADGETEQALRQLEFGLGPALRNANIILSTRPKGFDGSLDILSIQVELPVTDVTTEQLQSNETVETEEPSSEDSLDRTGMMEIREKTLDTQAEVTVVMLLPLDLERAKTYAQESKFPDVDATFAEIREKDADELTRRPFDIAAVFEYRKEHGDIGSRRDRQEALIQSQTREKKSKKTKTIPQDQAREGAERIALAMILARQFHILVGEDSDTTDDGKGNLDVQRLLSDWPPADVEALLRLPLFDLGAIGRVRFAHRTTMEYLAACRLIELRNNKLSRHDLHNTLFRRVHGEEVIPPSTREVVAWLSLDDVSVRRHVTKVMPELLIGDGDPGSLTIEARAEILNAMVTLYGEGTWRGISFGLTERRLFADPGLASAINRIWCEGPTNEEVRDLLVELIALGPIPDCGHIAHEVAMNKDDRDATRADAVRGLLKLERSKDVEGFVEAQIKRPKDLGSRRLIYLLPELAGQYLNARQIARIVRSAVQNGKRALHLDSQLIDVANKIDPGSAFASSLRDTLRSLILQGAPKDLDQFYIQSKYAIASQALGVLCRRQIEAGFPTEDRELINAAITASRFEDDNYSAPRGLEEVRKAVTSQPKFRPAIFWADLEFMENLFPEKPVRFGLFRVVGDRAAIQKIDDADRPWLLDALRDGSEMQREVALEVLLDLWRHQEYTGVAIEDLRTHTSDNRTLTARIDEAVAPRKPNPSIARSERELAKHQRDWDKKEQRRKNQWTKWESVLREKPDHYFSGKRVANSIVNLMQWFKRTERSGSDWLWWSTSEVIEGLGEQVLDAADSHVKAYWRRQNLLLASERKPEDRNSFPHSWIFGMNALAYEAEAEGWTQNLTDNEVRLAVRLSTLKLNGFAPFLSDLVRDRPNMVAEVFSRELVAQFGLLEEMPQQPLLHDIRYSNDAALQRLVAPTLMDMVENGPSLGGSAQQYALEMIESCSTPEELERITKSCREKFLADPFGPNAAAWLSIVFNQNFAAAVDAFLQAVSSMDTESDQDGAETLVANLFGDRGRSSPARFSADGSAKLAADLVRAVYDIVIPANDNVHDSVYTPNTRDHAESGRNAVLNILLSMNGLKARQQIIAMAREDRFSHFSDRLIYLSTEKIAKEADGEGLTLESVRRFDREGIAPPRNEAELLTVVDSRLHDIAHYVEDDDVAPREVWRMAQDEEVFQKLLTGELNRGARGQYARAFREPEVADKKKPDVVVPAYRGDFRVVVEIKVARKGNDRTAQALLDAIQDQLKKLYLRSDACRSGCFVVIHTGARKYWKHPTTGKRMTFPDLMDFLSEGSRHLEAGADEPVRIRVIGIDLTHVDEKPS